MIASRYRCVRGNHFHKETEQWVYILRGRIRYYWQEQGYTDYCYCHEGDMIHTPAGEPHAYKMDTNTLLLVMTRGPRAGAAYETDTYRLEEPLL